MKKEYKNNLQEFVVSCRLLYIYSKSGATANKYIVP